VIGDDRDLLIAEVLVWATIAALIAALIFA
jgi:hypothetical protein